MDRDQLIEVMLGISALIHFLPVIGALSAKRLESIYGIPVEGPDLAVLLRHRAVLFGILGGLLVAGIVHDDYRWIGLIAVLVSDLKYAALCLIHRDHNAQLAKVLRADVVSIVALVVAGVALAS